MTSLVFKIWEHLTPCREAYKVLGVLTCCLALKKKQNRKYIYYFTIIQFSFH
jgi:hypothetical protein